MGTDRSAPLPYTPANAPGFSGDLPRATWDEFLRLAGVLSSIDRPASLAVSCFDDLTVTGSPGWTRLFDDNTVTTWEAPTGMLGANGVWTCPMEGLYQLIYSGTAAPATIPGSSYALEIRSTRTFTDGTPDQVTTQHNSGPDSTYIPVMLVQMLRLNQGDSVVLDARGVGSSGATFRLSSEWQIQRVSGTR